MSERIEHEIEPVFDERSQVLVLGTMPSPKSREVGFFYGNPQNRFWKILASLFDEPLPISLADKRDLLLRRHIALWDVLASCDIEGASDASIRNASPNNFSRIFNAANIQAVFTTGTKATQLYRSLVEPTTAMPCTALPSPSPANAQSHLDDLIEAYEVLLPYLDEYTAPVLDVAQVAELEQTIAAHGTSLRQLMERAGRSIAYEVLKLVQDSDEPAKNATQTADAHISQTICILCGSGNNGGDGWVAARDLAERGFPVTVITTRAPEDLSAEPAHDAALEAMQTLATCTQARVVVKPDSDDISALLKESFIIIDALLGTGFSGDTLRAPSDEWVRLANEQRARGARIVAADVPSGLSAQTGAAADPCIQADETVTMIVPKTGLVLPEAAPFCGTVRVAPIAYIEPLISEVIGTE